MASSGLSSSHVPQESFAVPPVLSLPFKRLGHFASRCFPPLIGLLAQIEQSRIGSTHTVGLT